MVENLRTEKPFGEQTSESTEDAASVTNKRTMLEVGSGKIKDEAAKLEKFKEWETQSLQIHASNREEQAEDEDYYDSIQWDPKDKEELENRGQKAIVYNRIKPTVDWVMGTERRSKVDFKVWGREENDDDMSWLKTQLLKYVSDVNKVPFVRSQAFADTVKCGIGWIEVGIRGDDSDEPIFIDYESWRNIWYDPYAKKRDLSDSRFIFRKKWVDLEVALAMFPDKKKEIELSSKSVDYYSSFGEGEFFNPQEPWREVRNNTYAPVKGNMSSVDDTLTTRKRVRLVEVWYRQPETVKILHGCTEKIGTLEGLILHDDENNDDGYIRELVEDDIASLNDATKMVMRYAIYIDDHILVDERSPYRHNRFPFVPIWGWKRGRDGMTYGLIRGLKGPQDDLNKRHSKALHILCSTQVVADENAVNDWDELAREIARPDSIIKKKSGADFEITRDRGLAQEHVALMDLDARFIMENSGVGQDNLGVQSNAQSGEAIKQRKAQGEVSTTELFDNLHLAYQTLGEITLSLIEQYYDQPKVVRVLGEKGGAEYIKINQVNEQGDIENDITATQADFICDRADFRETTRQAMFESLMSMLGQMSPEISIQLLDVVMKLADVPEKDEIIHRIQLVNGKAPELQNQPPSPEEQLNLARLQAEVEKIQAEIDEVRAKSQLAVSQAQKEMATAQTKVAGVANDAEKRNIERAKVATEGTAKIEALQVQKAEILSKIEDSVAKKLKEAERDKRENARLNMEATRMVRQENREDVKVDRDFVLGLNKS